MGVKHYKNFSDSIFIRISKFNKINGVNKINVIKNINIILGGFKMLEQKDVMGNEKIIDDLNNTDNKYIARNEDLVGQDGNRAIKPTFFDAFKASIIDLVVVGAISTVGLFAADAILKIAGFAISEKFAMSFIIFMVVMVFYMSIMESGKKSATIGKKVARLIITKR